MPKTINQTYLIVLGLLIAGLLYLLAPILTPFLVGVLLAYLVDPAVNKLMRLRIPRLLAVVIVFLILFAVIVLLLVLLIPLIQDQIVTLTVVVPNTVDWLQNTILPSLKETFGIQALVDINTLKSTLVANWAKAGGIASWIASTVFHSGLRLLELLTNFVLIPVVTFYLLRDWNKVVKGVHDLIPRSLEPTVVKLVKECDSVLSAFFRGQLLVMLSLGIIYSVGLSLIGLQVGLVIGLISGLLSIVPYLGFIVGITAACIAAFVQFGTVTSVALVVLVYVIGQSIESMFLTPNLVGDRIGLHPVAVIFSILAGGTLFGFFGVLLALPVAAVVMVWIRYFNQRYRHSPLYKA